MSLSVRLPRRTVAVTAAMLVAVGLSSAPAAGGAPPMPVPNVADYTYLKAGETPPTQAQCNIAHRRCFEPSVMHAAYNLNPLLSQGLDGRGKTIAIVDSFGYEQAASDLKVFSQKFGLPLMCGMPGVSCEPGMAKFSRLQIGDRPVKEPPPSDGTQLEASNAWALEIALDLDWAHTMAPGANLVLVSTPTAETLGVQGLQQMMNLEQQVVDGHMADVISQSFGTGEEAFHDGIASLQNLRHAFESAVPAGVTVLASSGDGGTENDLKSPVKDPAAIPFPSVGWPASDPLVTAVGGTTVCLSALNGTEIDNTSPGAQCNDPANAGQREVVWPGSGGGFSHIFGRPAYQNQLPAGSTAIGSMRGVPDVALQASPTTGVLVYDTAPGDATSGVNCSGSPCSAGWYVVGGTSASSPQWAGLVAIADQIAGKRLGQINDDLYALANSPDHASMFFDVTKGNNHNPGFPDIPGFSATTGWDPVTGLGTPNAAVLLPALAAKAATTAP